MPMPAGIRPSKNSLIAKKPVFTFVLLNGSAAIVALVLYFSGTPSGMIVVSVSATFALINAMLVIMRRMVVTDVQAGTVPEARAAAPSKKLAWLFLVLGVYFLGSSLFQIGNPKLPSDKPLGFMMLIGSPAFLVMAWREFRKRASLK
jgi:hypothetical protein